MDSLCESGGRPFLFNAGFTDPWEIEGKIVAANALRARSPYIYHLANHGLFDLYRDYISTLRQTPLPAFDQLVTPLPAEHHIDAVIGEQARVWLHNSACNAPWFCRVGFSGPHGPMDSPRDWAEKFRDADIPAPP